MSELSPYQERYLNHQERKKRIIAGEEKELTPELPFSHKHAMDVFSEISKVRRSYRIYSGEEVMKEELGIIKVMADTCPSSCARRAIWLQFIDNKEYIQQLEGLLVGGVNWCGKADKIILLWADMLAYKSPNEIDFMPYLDAGVKIQQIYLTCTALGIKCCYINPNIRPDDKNKFRDKFTARAEVEHFFETNPGATMHASSYQIKDYYKFCGAITLGK